MSLLTRRDALFGALIYALGDTAATLIGGGFAWTRVAGMLLLGGTVYAIEIPAYFRWIDRRCNAPGNWNAWRRALLALAFFNPLWIARHLAFIALMRGAWAAIDWSLLSIAAKAFVHVAPFSLPINYLIQNGIALRWRFFASSLFSASMAVYLALSEVLFG